ncbi:hypothetical protein ZWY2020_034992 [Hordeum vulgare]|nr:hypothetical protein ZWY2020_034992 [Hordeum vulgare]
MSWWWHKRPVPAACMPAPILTRSVPSAMVPGRVRSNRWIRRWLAISGLHQAAAS